MQPPLKQVLISTSAVGALLGAIPALWLTAMAFLAPGNDDVGPAVVLQFEPVYLAYAVAAFAGALAISVSLFGWLPWLIHQGLARALRRQA